MRVTEDELIEIWRYFQYCCVPSIVMAKYAFLDYIGDIKKEKMFYRHERKQEINKIGKFITNLPNRLMDVSSQNIRYMNIFSDNIEELLQEDTEELHKAIWLTFKNAKAQHVDCFAAIHHIYAMLHIAAITYTQCCEDMNRAFGKNPTYLFKIFNMQGVAEAWDKVVDNATVFFGYEKAGKKDLKIDLNNPRCIKAIDSIRRKYADVETLRTAMRKSYPWSINYEEGVPYEKSADYIIVNSNNQETNEDDGINKES